MLNWLQSDCNHSKVDCNVDPIEQFSKKFEHRTSEIEPRKLEIMGNFFHTGYIRKTSRRVPPGAL